MEAARAGDTVAALTALSSLHLQYPEEVTIRYDYAVIAGWHGDHALAVDVLAALDVDGLPDYVLSAYADSARQTKQWTHASALYRTLSRRAGQFEAGVIGAALSLADACVHCFV